MYRLRYNTAKSNERCQMYPTIYRYIYADAIRGRLFAIQSNCLKQRPIVMHGLMFFANWVGTLDAILFCMKTLDHPDNHIGLYILYNTAYAVLVNIQVVDMWYILWIMCLKNSWCFRFHLCANFEEQTVPTSHKRLRVLTNGLSGDQPSAKLWYTFNGTILFSAGCLDIA